MLAARERAAQDHGLLAEGFKVVKFGILKPDVNGTERRS